MLSHAHMYAVSFNLNFIGTEHVLLALTDDSMEPSYSLLEKYGASQKDVMDEIIRLTGREPGAFVAREDDPNEIFAHCTNRTKRLLYLAEYLARRTAQGVVEPEHVLMAILKDGQSTAANILIYCHFDNASAMSELMEIIKSRSAMANYTNDDDGNDDNDIQRQDGG